MAYSNTKAEYHALADTKDLGVSTSSATHFYCDN